MRSRTYRSIVTLCLLGLLVAAPSEAKVYFSKSEAIDLAFPEVDDVESRTYVLDGAQTEAIQSLAKSKLESKLVTVYTGRRGGEVVGYAFIDVHRVRTLPEAFLVVLSPAGEVRTLRVLAFYEPEEYAPADRWLEQFHEKTLSRDLRLDGQIHGIAGSTLTSRAVTGGVRRALAYFQVLVQGKL